MTSKQSAAMAPLTFTDPSQIPLVLRLSEFCALTKRKEGGVRRALERGVCVPAPFATRPYRWRKADVLRWLEHGDRMSDGAGARTKKRKAA